MKLTAYVADGHTIDIRPAPVDRDWMDNIDQRFAYRCLPLSIANAHGWEILCAAGFTAVWDGGRGLDAVKVTTDPGNIVPALSHFGFGVLTFHVPCLFRTDVGFDLMVSGPINRPKDAIAPLTGLIETDWSPYSFTMNWQFTRPQTAVRFEKGEPFCHIMPVRRGEIETVEPELRSLSENPELQRQHTEPGRQPQSIQRRSPAAGQRSASREVAEAIPSRRHAGRRSGRHRRPSHAAQGPAVQKAGSRLNRAALSKSLPGSSLGGLVRIPPPQVRERCHAVFRQWIGVAEAVPARGAQLAVRPLRHDVMVRQQDAIERPGGGDEIWRGSWPRRSSRSSRQPPDF